MDDDEEEEISESDPRLMYIYQYLSKTLRFKVDKWQKMMALEDNRVCITLVFKFILNLIKQEINSDIHFFFQELFMKFFSDVKMTKLIIIISSTGMLTPRAEFPVSSKNKSVYFLRMEPVVLTEENMRDILLIGDMTPKPLEEFQVYLENVRLLLLI